MAWVNHCGVVIAAYSGKCVICDEQVVPPQTESFDQRRVSEIERQIATFQRYVIYLEKELQACAVIPPTGWKVTMQGAVMATVVGATAEDSAPINKRQELDDKIVKWFDGAEDEERRALMLCTKRYIDLMESRVTRDTVEAEIRKELARLKK